jgi:hypothetical protein
VLEETREERGAQKEERKSRERREALEEEKGWMITNHFHLRLRRKLFSIWWP